MPKATATRFFYVLHYPLTRIWAFYHFRIQSRIREESIQQKDGVLFAPNHQNAFLDGFVVAHSVSGQIRILTRGDAFKHPLASKFLMSHGLIPIYRERDGRDALEKNDAIFELTNNILLENGKVLVFPEANCIVEKRVRPIKKGTARMAFMASDLIGKDKPLWLQPTGITYSDQDGVRPMLRVEFGEPFNVTELRNTESGEARAMLQTTRRIEDGMRVVTLDYPVEWNADTMDTVLEIAANEAVGRPQFSIRKWNAYYDLQQKLIAKLRTADETQRTSISGLVQSIQASLKVLALPVDALETATPSQELKRCLILALTFPVAIEGLMAIKPVTALANGIVSKYVKEKQFIASVSFAIGMFTFVPWWLFRASVVSALFGWQTGAAVLAVTPITSWLALHWFDQLKALRNRMTYRKALRDGNSAAKSANENKASMLELLD
jgi:1-acyl-sn-glycerol-3-phosphate acyltransferase